MKALTYIEIDIDSCMNVYGTYPCEAVLGVTGDIKCFNSLGSCQDRVNFFNSPVSLRFCKASEHYPHKTIEAIPSLVGVSFTPAEISLGENLGVRAMVTATFKDHRYSDTGPGFDPYRTERPYDPFKQGTFWGKFRARNPFVTGRPLRVIRGNVGQSLEEMETRHYVMESFEGPRPDGTFTIIAQDILKLADNDRAQAPLLSEGVVSANIGDNDASLAALPSGVGNAFYPASGYIAVGGKEIMGFTRSGDTFSITRGQLGTIAVAHQADERIQLVLRYDGIDPALIIADLLENYAGVPSEYIPVSAWQNETASFLQRVYTATIAEPTGVNKLISELVQQAALAIWWDDRLQQIRLQVLRQISTDAGLFNDANIIGDSLRTKDQPAKRLSQVWTYFGQRDPLKKIDEVDNYRSAAATVDLQSQSDYGAAAIKKIFSRWIPFGGRSVALRLNDIILGRYVTPPRRVEFELLKVSGNEINEQVNLGGGYRLEAWPIQDVTGGRSNIPIQVTRINPNDATLQVEAEEALFQPFDPDSLLDRVIIVDSNFNNFNLREAHDSLYPEIVETYGITVTCIIETGVIVGSTSVSAPAFDVGDWVPDVPITVRVLGRIQGKGGDGAGLSPPSTTVPAEAGGTALYTRYPIDLDLNSTGEVWGGGGGGGAGVFIVPVAGGGGGAGQVPGNGGAVSTPENNGQPGAQTAGGQGGTGGSVVGGDGGDPGQPGQAGSPGSAAGAAGIAIDGDSFITVVNGPGDIQGPQVN